MQSSDQWRVLVARLALANHDSPEAVQNSPSLEQTLALFARLGSGEGGDLFISGSPGERELMVSGGPSLYLISCVGDGYGAYNLVDPAANRDGWLTLHVGGVPSAVEASATVGAELAEKAIRYFHAHGNIDQQLQWE